MPPGQILLQTADDGDASLVHVEHPGNRGRNSRRIARVGEGDEERTIFEGAQRLDAEMKAERGLADARWPRDTQQPHAIPEEAFLRHVEVALPSNELRKHKGQVRWAAIEGSLVPRRQGMTGTRQTEKTLALRQPNLEGLREPRRHIA